MNGDSYSRREILKQGALCATAGLLAVSQRRAEALSSSHADVIIQAGQSRFGVPYRLGASADEVERRVAADCSSLTQWAYRRIGLNLPRTAAEQWTAASPGNERAGLVFFNRTRPEITDGRITHVGINLGNGRMINANSYVGVQEESFLTGSYWPSRVVGYRTFGSPPPPPVEWRSLGGQTPFAGSFAALDSTFVAVRRELSSRQVYWSEFTYEGQPVQPWHGLPAWTHNSPDVARVAGDRVAFAWTAEDGHIYIGHHNTANADWSGIISTGRYSTAAPSIVGWGNTLYIFHKGMDESMWLGAYSLDVRRWSPWWPVRGQLRDRPSLCLWQNRLYGLHRGVDYQIHTLDLSSYLSSGYATPWEKVEGRFTDRPPSFCEHGGRLRLIHKGLDNAEMYYGSRDPGAQWTGWERLPGLTGYQPGVFSGGGKLFVSHVGLDCNLNWGVLPR